MTSNFKKFPQFIFNTLKSLGFAVVIILALAVIAAVGTIIEAQYDADYAQRLVYKSVYMYLALGFLCASLIAVMVDRWPWRRHHSAFVCAHIGILILLLGSWVTQRFGIDGSMIFGIDEKERSIILPDHVLKMYATFDAQQFTPLFERKVDFFARPPGESIYDFDVAGLPLRVLDYSHYGVPTEDILPSENPLHPPALRFQLFNDQFSFTKWIRPRRKVDPAEVDLGPARVKLISGLPKSEGENELILRPEEKGDGLRFWVFRKGEKIRTGVIKEGQVKETGWAMGLKLRVLKYHRFSERKLSIKKEIKPNNLTTKAILIEFMGEKTWVALNQPQYFFDRDKAWVVSFANERFYLDFDMHLKKFEIGRYQGTLRAASYQSVVEVPGLGERVISMNQPLKIRGLTFYQASFESDETGRPVASILSVNRDPGRWLKYLGSALIVVGTILLFYFKKAIARGFQERKA